MLTGHEDGTVRFWDASGIALQPLYKFGSAQVFSGDEITNEGSNGANDEEEDEWPPFRKVCSCFVIGNFIYIGTIGFLNDGLVLSVL